MKERFARHIVHLSIPDFCAALEELRRPELKRKPLILVEPVPRAIVLGVNPVARAEGLMEGMPIYEARRFCRKLHALPPDLPFYREQHQMILRELGYFSPLVEGAVLGRYFVDLSGTRRLWGPVPDTAFRMEEKLVSKRGLQASVGLASNKLVSEVASKCLIPGEMSCIFEGGEACFLSPLPVHFLPGVGPKTVLKLSDFNIGQIGQLAMLSGETLADVFGKTAYHLLKMARGMDSTPVLSSQNLPHLRRIRSLERDEIEREKLEAALFQLVEEMGWELRSHNRCPERFALEIRYADGCTVRSSNPLGPVMAQIDLRLFKMVLPAFKKLLQRRVAVRRMVLEFSDFSIPFRQMSLFPWEEDSLREDQNLQNALDGIRQRFGGKSIRWGKTLAGGLEGTAA